MRIAIDPLDAYPLDRAMKIAEEHNLMLEVQMEPPVFSWNPDFISTLENIAKNYGLVLHAPYREVFLASIHPLIQRSSIQLVKESIDLAADVGAEILVTHLGNFNRKQPREDVLDRLVPALREILDYAREKNIVLAVENVAFGPVGVAPSDFFYLFEQVGLFSLCIDVAHAYSSGNLDAFLDLFPEAPIYHFSDTIYGKDLHAELGSGEVPWKSVLERINENAVIVLEVGGDTPALQSLERLRRMISELNHS